MLAWGRCARTSTSGAAVGSGSEPDNINAYIMQNYLTQLLEDLHAATLAQWRRRPPHFYQVGIRDAMHQAPEGYVEKPAAGEMPGDFEATIDEVETYLHGKPAINMFDHFGFEPEQFPPAEQLTEAQAQGLVDALVRLWVAYNFLPTIPRKTPARIFYPAMLQRMAKPATLLERGVAGIEFCSFNSEECPFGTDNCSCTDY